MKKILTIFIIIISLFSCSNQKDDNKEDHVSNRIILKDAKMCKGIQFLILEVDGKEYMTSSSGGFVLLDSKNISDEK